MAGEQSFKAVVHNPDPDFKFDDKHGKERTGGKAYGFEITGSNYNHFLGKKIGDSVDGMFVGNGEFSLNGFKLEIVGGSDVTGRPMRPDLDGSGVKSVLITAGIGYKGKKYINKNSKEYRYKYKGLRRRRNLRGNVISQDTRQISLKIDPEEDEPDYAKIGSSIHAIITGEEAPAKPEAPAEQSSTEEE